MCIHQVENEMPKAGTETKFNKANIYCPGPALHLYTAAEQNVLPEYFLCKQHKLVSAWRPAARAKYPSQFQASPHRLCL